MIRSLTVASLIGAALVDIAAAKSPPRSVPIAVADLDLSNEAGQAQLDRRIKRAALRVCGARIVGDKVGNASIEACRADAIAKARREAAILVASGKKDTRLAVYSR